MTPRGVVLLYSGGIDSTLVALHLADRGWNVHALSIQYDHRPAEEVRAARRVARALPFASWHEIAVRGLAIGPPPAARGAAKDRASLEGVIAHRNIVFWSLAANRARALGATAIAAGHTREDARSYTDAAPAFFDALAPLLASSGVAGLGRLDLLLPLRELPARHWRAFARRRRDLFDSTWSCWRDGAAPCRQCFACVQRNRFLGDDE
jgi:7-cyano-7-deazaguanine synthase